jgi:ParB-like chromosome segregation protein Spo0J
MRITRNLPLSCIRIDRLPFRRVLDLVRHLEAGGTVPPIKVQKTERGFRILDGRHRFMAFKLLGRPTIPATYWTSREDRPVL